MREIDQRLNLDVFSTNEMSWNLLGKRQKRNWKTWVRPSYELMEISRRSHSINQTTNMADAMRALLDELMGPDRNLGQNEKNHNRRNFNDDTVCKYYLCGFCPHDLFTNTKSDLGLTAPSSLDICRTLSEGS